MQKVPYEFVEKVLIQMDSDQINKLRLTSSIWSSQAAVHSTKRRTLNVVLYATENGLKYKITNSAGSKLALDVVLRMDQRFNHVAELSVLPLLKDENGLSNISIKKLRELSKFMSHFCLKKTKLVLPEMPDQLHSQVLKLLSSSSFEWTTQSLELNYVRGAEEFVKAQLKNTQLIYLSIRGEWPRNLLDNVQVYLCGSSVKLKYDAECLSFKKIKIPSGEAIEAEREEQKSSNDQPCLSFTMSICFYLITAVVFSFLIYLVVSYYRIGSLPHRLFRKVRKLVFAFNDLTGSMYNK